MTPAFSSTKQAGAFAFLLLIILLLPILAGKSGLPPRERIYSSAPWGVGAYPYLQKQFFEEKGDIDIAFIGSSVEYLGIDTPEVQQSLSKKLGRPAVVRSLCWYWLGFDALYFITEDLLRNRKVHMLVFTDETGGNSTHPEAERWFRFGDNKDALKGLPPQFGAGFYAEAVLGMPRNLLNLIEPEESLRPFSYQQFNLDRPARAEDPSKRLGSLSAEEGFDVNDPFVEYSPQNKATPSDVCRYSPDTNAKFRFSHSPFPRVQFHFAQEFANLAKKNATRLVFLSVPFFSDMRSPVIPVAQNWPELLHSNIAILGVPPATLFANLSDDDVKKLYFNNFHFNKNGQRYFTSVVGPALVDLYYAQTIP
jgi:hypothetical protein